MTTIDHGEVDPPSLGKEMVEKMTNWQRTRWARAGYPGLRGGNYDAAQIRPYYLAQIQTS